MKLKPKQYPYGCRLTAYSYVTGLPEETLVALIGHDGSEIVRKAKEPFNRRAFHPQEIIDAIYPEYLVVEIHYNPSSDGYELPVGKDRLNRYLEHSGVLEGWGKSGCYHAVARINGETINPDTGDTFDMTGFVPEIFYMVIKNANV